MTQAPDQTKEQTQSAAARPASRPKQEIKMKPIATRFYNVKILAPFAITPCYTIEPNEKGKWIFDAVKLVCSMILYLVFC